MLSLPAENAKKLYISFCGLGTGRQKKANSYPCFLRWKYVNFLDGGYMCIEDPMYAKNTELVQWYYGTRDVSYLHAGFRHPQDYARKKYCFPGCLFLWQFRRGDGGIADGQPDQWLHGHRH